VNLARVQPPPGYAALLVGEPRPGDWSAPLGAPSGCWMSEEVNPRTGQPACRVLLWRTFMCEGCTVDSPPDAYGMMNPSTATHEALDPTVRRVIGYCDRDYAGGLIVVNRSPWRATDQDDLERDHLGGADVLRVEANAAAWAVAASLARRLILAWGTPRGSWPEKVRAHDAALLAPFSGRTFTIGRLSKQGQPRHPLYLPGDEPMLPAVLRDGALHTVVEA